LYIDSDNSTQLFNWSISPAKQNALPEDIHELMISPEYQHKNISNAFNIPNSWKEQDEVDMG
jgi:hypothetical protein